METSEILNKAADLIERDGWCSLNPNALNVGLKPQCASNAISAIEPIERGTNGNAAQYAFSVYVAGERSLSAIWNWNDADDRTAAEVIEALRACALIEAAKENAEARTLVNSDAS